MIGENVLAIEMGADAIDIGKTILGRTRKRIRVTRLHLLFR
jgi:hypothetical protein